MTDANSIADDVPTHRQFQ